MISFDLGIKFLLKSDNLCIHFFTLKNGVEVEVDNIRRVFSGV